ncbi:MAG: hypothetical protein ACK559_16555, partial [bacterium]
RAAGPPAELAEVRPTPHVDGAHDAPLQLGAGGLEARVGAEHGPGAGGDGHAADPHPELVGDEPDAVFDDLHGRGRAAPHGADLPGAAEVHLVPAHELAEVHPLNQHAELAQGDEVLAGDGGGGRLGRVAAEPGP